MATTFAKPLEVGEARLRQLSRSQAPPRVRILEKCLLPLTTHSPHMRKHAGWAGGKKEGVWGKQFRLAPKRLRTLQPSAARQETSIVMEIPSLVQMNTCHLGNDCSLRQAEIRESSIRKVAMAFKIIRVSNFAFVLAGQNFCINELENRDVRDILPQFCSRTYWDCF